MPHFFISSENISDNTVTISDKENYNHIAKSLRIKENEKLLLIDENQIQYETVVKSISKNDIQAQIQKQHNSKRFLPFNLYLAQSPLRNNDSQNFVIEKATELGVKGIYPIHTDNCAVSAEVINKKIDKWQKVMYEASKQCERANIPTCFPQTTLDELINKFDRIIVFCERIATKTLKNVKPLKENETLLVIIGPEGGFSQKEFDLFKNRNLEMLTLGDMILKAETAVTVGLGNIVYEFTTSEN